MRMEPDSRDTSCITSAIPAVGNAVSVIMATSRIATNLLKLSFILYPPKPNARLCNVYCAGSVQPRVSRTRQRLSTFSSETVRV